MVSSLSFQNAENPETIILNDGDVYEMIAGYVVKKIGNTEVKMMAYNGMIPGPMIKVKQGSTVTINFKNNLDIPTTIHSHGIRLDNKNDGTDLTQKRSRTRRNIYI